MEEKQSGFTLVELVIVIIILGLLAAVAVPKFINLSGDAKTAATSSIAGALSSANSVNYASRTESASNGSAVTNCSDGASLLQGGLPTGYSITAAAITAGATATCTLTGPGGATATFTLTGIA